MRKLLTSIVLFMLFSMFSGTAFAGKYPECDDFKGFKRLYGLCNAYQNALFHEDEEAMADISRNWDKWWDEEDGLPGLPNRPDDIPTPDPDPVLDPVVCPCWTYEVLESAIRCDGYNYAFHIADESQSGSDLLVLMWQDPFDDQVPPEMIQISTGTLYSMTPECRLAAQPEYVNGGLLASPVDEEEELLCREQVVNLTLEALSPGPCN